MCGNSLSAFPILVSDCFSSSFPFRVKLVLNRDAETEMATVQHQFGWAMITSISLESVLLIIIIRGSVL